MWTHDSNEKIGQWLQGVPCSVLIHFLCASYVSTLCSICHMCPVAAHPDFLLPHSKTTFLGAVHFYLMEFGALPCTQHIQKSAWERRDVKRSTTTAKPRYDDKEKRKKGPQHAHLHICVSRSCVTLQIASSQKGLVILLSIATQLG